MAKAPAKKKHDFSGMDISGAGFMQNLNEAIPVKARYNTGLNLDLITGRPQKGRFGDTIVNGGISPYTGVVGGPNQGKSTWVDTMGIILNAHYDIPYLSHNNEADAQPERAREISWYHTDKFINFEDEMRKHPTFRMLDLSAYSAADMHEVIRQLAFEREKRRGELMRDTPFLDEDGKVIQVMHPFAHSQDSLSQWQSNVVEGKMNDNEVGSKDRQTFGLMHGMSKTQMIAEFPTFCARGGMMFFQTAHLGTKYSLDPYAPKRKKLEFLAGDIDIKFASNNFTYLPNNLWWVMGNAPLLKKGSDGKYYPEFPDSEAAKIERDSDLTLMSMANLRGKSGPSGIPYEMVASQARGIIPYLTNFRYIWESEIDGQLGFGVSGNDRSAYLDIYPDVKFTRFNIRQVAENDPRMQRAIRITADLCILTERIRNYPRAKLCTPAELYEAIKKQYDWNEILDTRDRWTWDHYENPVKYLSIYDLLNMRLGEYVPYWKQ